MALSAGTAVLNVVPDLKGLQAQIAGPTFQKLGSSMGGKLMLGMGVGIAAGGAIIAKKAFDAAQEFDKGLKIIRRGTGATGEALEAMGESSRRVFRAVPQDFETVSRTLAQLNTRTGATGENLEGLTQTMLDLARVTGEDVNALIPSTTRLFGDWSIATEDQASTLDHLFKISQATGIEVSDLSAKMVQFGSPLRQLGVDFEFGAAMFAQFEKQGVNVQTLMPGLRMALKNFSKPTADLSKIMQKLGIDIRDGPEVALQGIFEAIKDAPSTLEANALAFEVFGARAGPDMAAAVREGRFELEDFMAEMGKSPETIDKAAKASLSLGEQWDIVKNNLNDLLVPLGQKLLPVLQQAIQWFTKAIQPTGSLGKMFDFVGRNAEALAKIAGGVLAAAIGVKVVNAFRALTLAMMANPFVAITAAVIALATLIVLNWDTIKEKTVAVFGGIKDFLSKTWGTIKNTIAKIVGDILAFLTRGFTTFLEVFVKIGRGILDTAVAAFGWIPGIGDKVKRFRALFDNATRGIISDLRKQGQEFDRWGEKANRAFTSASVKLAEFNKQVSNLEGLKPINVNVSGGVGDGFGVPTGGSRLARVQAAMKGLPGLYISSTYRPGAVTASGRPSYHANKADPAVDVGFLRTGASPRLVDILYQRLARTAHRELIWRSAGHYDHLHYAKHGFHGWVNKATGFVAGEAGRERVDITPEGKLDATPGKFKIVGKLRLVDGDAFIEGALERVVGRAGA